MPGPERESGRIPETPAKARRDRIFRRIHPELASKASVGAADRLQRLEQRPSSIEERSANHFICQFSPSQTWINTPNAAVGEIKNSRSPRQVRFSFTTRIPARFRPSRGSAEAFKAIDA